MELSERAIWHARERHGLLVAFQVIEDTIVDPDAIYIKFTLFGSVDLCTFQRHPKTE
ncbi:hypothetical protein TPY_2710 [Sulfobacillus acidophilus TPY]|nr:hypothetical protein TPY_2710 [Sulfobacillus acidophilus TPY]